MRRTFLILGVIAALVAVSACGKSKKAAPKPANAVSIDMREYAFEVDGTPKPGPLMVNYRNTGKELHMSVAGRLDAGKTIDDVREYVQNSSDGPPPAWFHDDPGDLSILSPGQSYGVEIDASQAGTYVLLCFLPTPGGKPHVAEGMMQTFEIAGTSEASSTSADATFTVSDASVTAPALEDGATIVEVKNTGTTPADFNVARLAEGKTLDDVDPWFESMEGPPPATFLGGTHGVEPGKSVVMTLHLEPGTYTAVASFEIEGQDEPKDVSTTFTVA